MKVSHVALSNAKTQFQAIDPYNKTHAAQAVQYADTSTASIYDWIIFSFFIIDVLLLLVTAFLINNHPAFFFIYIVAAFFLVVLMSPMQKLSNKIYTAQILSQGSDNVVQYLPVMQFVANNFISILIGVIAISAIIMFGKFAMAPSAGGKRY